MKEFLDRYILLRRTFIIYHLMSVRVLLSFDRLGFLARSSARRKYFKELPHVQDRLIDECLNVTFHCGQNLKLVRMLPQDKKPTWRAAGKVVADSFPEEILNES